MCTPETVLAERNRVERLLRTAPVAVCGTGYDLGAEAAEIFYTVDGNYVCVRITVNSLGDDTRRSPPKTQVMDRSHHSTPALSGCER